MPVSDVKNGNTLGLMGAKGGVGTTVLASSLAWALAQRSQRVVLLDLDGHGGQAALHLCERNAGPTVREALGVIERLDDTLLDTLLTPCSPALRLLPAPRQWGPPAAEPPHDAASLLKLVRTATALADWVLIDLPRDAMTQIGLGPVLRELDEVVLVTEPSLPATFNARRAWQWLNDHRPPSAPDGPRGIGLVLNKAQAPNTLPTDQVLRTLGLDDAQGNWREVPRSDAAVAQATYRGQAVGAVDPRNPLARALSRWAAELVERRAQTDGTGEADAAQGADGPVRSSVPLVPWRERLLRWAS